MVHRIIKVIKWCLVWTGKKSDKFIDYMEERLAQYFMI